MCSTNEHAHERLVSLIVSFNERTNEHAARADRAKRAKRAPPPATTMKRRGTKRGVRGGYLEKRERQCRSKSRGMIGRRTNRWEAASGGLVLAFLEAHEALINCTTGGSTASRWGDECSLGFGSGRNPKRAPATEQRTFRTWLGAMEAPSARGGTTGHTLVRLSSCVHPLRLPIGRLLQPRSAVLRRRR